MEQANANLLVSNSHPPLHRGKKMSFHIALRREFAIGLSGIALGAALLLSAFIASVESNGWQAVGTTTVSSECPDSNGWQCASL